MKILLVPTYKIKLKKLDLSKRESYTNESRANSFYLKMAPFFVGRDGDKGARGEKGDPATANFLSTVDW